MLSYSVNMKEVEVKKSVTDLDPLGCQPKSIRGHIVNTHFKYSTMAWYGVAEWDLGLAEFRRIPMDWVIKKACDLITQPDDVMLVGILREEPLYRLFQHRFAVYEKKLGWDYLVPQSHRMMLVKNLHAMNNHGLLGEFDWDPIEKFVPGASNMTVDVTQDTMEKPFEIMEALTQSLSIRYGRFDELSDNPLLHTQVIPVNLGFLTR
jgi:hypothetical protein